MFSSHFLLNGSPRLPPVARGLGGAELTLAAALFGAVDEAQAEERAIHSLMGESVTLFDLGIARLRQELQSTAERMADMADLPATPLRAQFTIGLISTSFPTSP